MGNLCERDTFTREKEAVTRMQHFQRALVEANGELARLNELDPTDPAVKLQETECRKRRMRLIKSIQNEKTQSNIHLVTMGAAFKGKVANVNIDRASDQDSIESDVDHVLGISDTPVAAVKNDPARRPQEEKRSLLPRVERSDPARRPQEEKQSLLPLAESHTIALMT
jgi:hypothetical protein